MPICLQRPCGRGQHGSCSCQLSHAHALPAQHDQRCTLANAWLGFSRVRLVPALHVYGADASHAHAGTRTHVSAHARNRMYARASLSKKAMLDAPVSAFCAQLRHLP